MKQALNVATFYEKPEIVDLLLNHGAHINTVVDLVSLAALRPTMIGFD